MGVVVIVEKNEGINVVEEGGGDALCEGCGAHVITRLVEEVGGLLKGPELVCWQACGDFSIGGRRWRGEVKGVGGCRGGGGRDELRWSKERGGGRGNLVGVGRVGGVGEGVNFEGELGEGGNEGLKDIRVGGRE